MRTTDIEVSTLRFGNPSIRRLLLRLERPSPVASSGQLRGKDAIKSAIDESPLGTAARWSRCADYIASVIAMPCSAKERCAR
jgi:hypothetical protein